MLSSRGFMHALHKGLRYHSHAMKLEDCRLILVFGGTFDPPHLADFALPQQVRDRIGADVVAYVPAAQSPHKLDQQPTDAAHRLAMLRLALQGQPHTAIVTDELDRAQRGEPSYTVDTLQQLHDRLGEDVTLRLLIGADQVPAFERWKAPQRIIELAEPVVMLRPPETVESLLQALPNDKARRFWARRLVPVSQMEVSATEIRRRLAAGEPVDDLLPMAVARYIREHGLYGAATG